MTEPRAYRNDQLVPQSQLTVPVTDAGFVQGLTVAEQLRTFNGKLFRLDEHLQRLQRSLDIVGVDPHAAMEELAERAIRLVEHNFALLPAGGDLGIAMFVTPGPYGAYQGEGPLVGMHTTPLAFDTWARRYDDGQPLRIVNTRQVPTQCWPAELKCRSRMHYFLADREARQLDPDSRALLLDVDGWVTEASTANVVFYFESEGFVSPPEDTILPGISVAALRELAEAAGIAWIHRQVNPQEILEADEVLLCSTSICVLPVLDIDGHPIGDGKPGDVYRRLLTDWSELVRMDIRKQALEQARG